MKLGKRPKDVLFWRRSDVLCMIMILLFYLKKKNWTKNTSTSCLVRIIVGRVGEEFWQHYCQLPYYILIKNHRYIIWESNFKEYKAGYAGKVYTSEQFKRKYNKELVI